MDKAKEKSNFQYDVFICYSRMDRAFAEKLEKALKAYIPPKDLPVPQRRLNVFRDESDIIGVELNEALERNLQGSAKLIVICSPDSRKSLYVKDEIESFGRARGKENIIPLLVRGIPNNEATTGQESELAFPEALVKLLLKPLAAEFRGFSQGRGKFDRGKYEYSWYKTLSDIYSDYGITRAQVEQREKRRQVKRQRVAAGIISIVFALLISMSLWALIERAEAIRQRDKAVRQAQIALSQKLSTEAMMTTDDNVDRALLLGLVAFDTYPTAEARLSLFVTLLRGRYAKFERGHAPVDITMNASSFSCEMNLAKIQAMVNKGAFQDWPDFNDLDFKNGTCYATSGDGSRIAVITQVPWQTTTIRYPAKLAIWETKSRQKMTAETIHSGDITAFKFSPDGKSLVSGDSDGIVLLWRYNGSRGWYYERLYGHRQLIRRVDFESDGRILVTESADGDIIHWDLRRPQSLAVVFDDQKTSTPQDFGWTRVAFAKMGRLVIALGARGRLLAWENSTVVGSARELTAISGAARSLAVSNNGELIAIASNREVRVLHLDSGHEYTSPLSCYQVAGLSFSIDNEIVAIGGIRCFQLWRFRSEKTPQSVEMPSSLAGLRIYATRFTPDGSALILCGTFGVLKYLLQSKSMDAPPQVLYRGGLVTKIALSQDGQRLAAGLWEGDVVVLSLSDPQEPPMKLIAHRGGAITGLAFSPEADILASCDASGIAMLWDLNRGELLVSELKGGGISATGLAFSPDGSAFAIGSDDRVVTVWPFGIDAWRKCACAIANRELTPKEWQFFVTDQTYRSICRDPTPAFN